MNGYNICKDDSKAHNYTCINFVLLRNENYVVADTKGERYLGVQFIAFVIFKAVSILPEWLTIVICTIILGVFALLTITGQAAKNERTRVEAKKSSKRYFL